jgi:imidazole glycerol-phosphate synthase subunit HisH
MIALIDYGVGNLKSVENALQFFHKDIKVDIVADPDHLKLYPKIILPGVGAFGDAIRKVRGRNFDDAIYAEVKKGKYFLGICLGMQMLATKSFEYGEHKGLNLIEGEVINFRNVADNIKIPHMGWNDVKFLRDDSIFSSIENGSDFYFVHSYFFRCKFEENIMGITEYGITFPAVINKGNIYGAQFHPEKSQEAGLKFMKNFLEL